MKLKQSQIKSYGNTTSSHNGMRILEKFLVCCFPNTRGWNHALPAQRSPIVYHLQPQDQKVPVSKWEEMLQAKGRKDRSHISPHTSMVWLLTWGFFQRKKATKGYLLFDTGEDSPLHPWSVCLADTLCVCVCVCVSVCVCVGGFLLPWLVILLFREFTVTCSTTWTLGLSSEMRKELRNG